jgi:hypothetical protein
MTITTVTASPDDAPSSNYRCRVHLDRSVTPRGKGCVDCARLPVAGQVRGFRHRDRSTRQAW